MIFVNNQEITDRKWMRMALDLAGNGEGASIPIPLVGAVIVKRTQLSAKGWHAYCGGLHAERNALKDCREATIRRARRFTSRWNPAVITVRHLPVPSDYRKRIVPSRLRRLGSQSGGSGERIQILRAAGIETEGPVMEAECLEKNRIFFHYITEKTPYVIMKYAMTADGKIACVTGDSRWVTAEEAREHTHRTRRAVTGIMVGIHTVLQDDPMLNCRWKEDPVDPVRIVCDSRLRIPLESRIVRRQKMCRLW